MKLLIISCLLIASTMAQTVYHFHSEDARLCTEFAIPEHCTNSLEYMDGDQADEWHSQFIVGKCSGVSEQWDFDQYYGKTDAGGCTSPSDDYEFRIHMYGNRFSAAECNTCADGFHANGGCDIVLKASRDNPPDRDEIRAKTPEACNSSCQSQIISKCIKEAPLDVKVKAVTRSSLAMVLLFLAIALCLVCCSFCFTTWKTNKDFNEKLLTGVYSEF